MTYYTNCKINFNTHTNYYNYNISNKYLPKNCTIGGTTTEYEGRVEDWFDEEFSTKQYKNIKIIFN